MKPGYKVDEILNFGTREAHSALKGMPRPLFISIYSLSLFNQVSVMQIKPEETIFVIRAGDGAGSIQIMPDETWF